MGSTALAFCRVFFVYFGLGGMVWWVPGLGLLVVLFYSFLFVCLSTFCIPPN